jgi:hypothetical protein
LLAVTKHFATMTAIFLFLGMGMDCCIQQRIYGWQKGLWENIMKKVFYYRNSKFNYVIKKCWIIPEHGEVVE